MALDEAFIESTSDESHDEAAPKRKKRQTSGDRVSRTTYVKAILANPKISASQHRALKLAEAELKSPKMQETFKKLTAVHSPRQSRRGVSGLGEVASAFDRSACRSARSVGPRKRKRKRHKSRRRNGPRGIDQGRGKVSNWGVRLTRQAANSSAKSRTDRRRNRRAEAAGHLPNESSDGLEPW